MDYLNYKELKLNGLIDSVKIFTLDGEKHKAISLLNDKYDPILFEGCEMVSEKGIECNRWPRGNYNDYISYTIKAVFNKDNEEHLIFVNLIDKIYKECVEILMKNKKELKICVTDKESNLHYPIVDNKVNFKIIKNPGYHNTAVFVDNSTVFVGLNNNVVDLDILTNCVISFIPLICLNKIYITDEDIAYITMSIRSAVITGINNIHPFKPLLIDNVIDDINDVDYDYKYINYNNFDIKEMISTEPIDKLVKGIGGFYTMTKFLYNYGEDCYNELYIEGCEMKSNMGLQINSTNTEYIDAKFGGNLTFINMLKNIFSFCKLKRGKRDCLDGILHDFNNGEIISRSNPLITLKINKKNNCTFYDINNNIINKEELKNAFITFIPIIHISHIHTQNRRASIQLYIRSSIIIKKIKHGQESGQISTINALIKQRPDIIQKVEQQILLLKGGDL